MKQKLGSFLTGLAAFRRSFDEIATRTRHENDLALLKAQLIRPIQTHLEIASFQCTIDIELQDPGLRKIFNSIELEIPDISGGTTTFSSANVTETLSELEKSCQRDAAFAARLAYARQEFSDELREIRGKLQGDCKLHEAFRRIFNAHDALDSLRILGSLGSTRVPPSHALIHETDELAALLRATPASASPSQVAIIAPLKSKSAAEVDPDHLIQAIQDGHITADSISVDAIFRIARIDRSLKKELRHGTAILSNSDQCDNYLYTHGLMVQKQWNQVLKGKELDGSHNFHIIDYGCGQGLASALVFDFFNKKLRKLTKKLTLIEPSEAALVRAEVVLHGYCPHAEIAAIHKNFNTMASTDITAAPDYATIHIFSNVLDIDGYDQFSLLNKALGTVRKNRQYILAVSHNRDFDGGAPRIRALHKAFKELALNSAHVFQNDLTSFNTYDSNGKPVPQLSWWCEFQSPTRPIELNAP
ncbi:MAG: hypothetical protein ABI859_15715 [Pseudomonadota bacterium]